jgi:hypothetical protein
MHRRVIRCLERRLAKREVILAGEGHPHRLAVRAWFVHHAEGGAQARSSQSGVRSGLVHSAYSIGLHVFARLWGCAHGSRPAASMLDSRSRPGPRDHAGTSRSARRTTCSVDIGSAARVSSTRTALDCVKRPGRGILITARVSAMPPTTPPPPPGCAQKLLCTIAGGTSAWRLCGSVQALPHGKTRRGLRSIQPCRTSEGNVWAYRAVVRSLTRYEMTAK